MGVVRLLGEIKQKDGVKEFEFFQIETFDDIEEIASQMGKDAIVECLNIGLQQIARKGKKANRDPKLTPSQAVQIQRMNDLIALGALTRMQALTILVEANGYPIDLVEANLERKEN